MAEGTAIEWADHTFNPWWGCARVSAACQHCYAETLANRFQPGLWGKAGDRRFFGDKHWNEPRRWDRAAAKAGRSARVFCASMADVFENRPDLVEHRDRLWGLIMSTPHLTWLLLTKRPENIPIMVPWHWMQYRWPEWVHIGTTVESDEHVGRADHLRALPAPVRFLSCEPLLGPLPSLDLTGIGHVIVGGESGHGSRPMHPAWVRDLRDRSSNAGVPFLFKQWGDWGPAGDWPGPDHHLDVRGNLYLPGEAAPIATDRVELAAIHRWGKKAAGRELDGRTWDELPG